MAVQWELFDRARKYAEEHGLEGSGPGAGRLVLEHWETVLTGLEADPMSVADRIDWVAKYRVLDAYRERDDLAWYDGRLAALALQYHDLRPAKSLAQRVGLVRVTNDAEVARAVTEPPEDTRAFFRGRCLQKWASQIVAANSGLDRASTSVRNRSAGSRRSNQCVEPRPTSVACWMRVRRQLSWLSD